MLEGLRPVSIMCLFFKCNQAGIAFDLGNEENLVSRIGPRRSADASIFVRDLWHRMPA